MYENIVLSQSSSYRAFNDERERIKMSSLLMGGVVSRYLNKLNLLRTKVMISMAKRNRKLWYDKRRKIALLIIEESFISVVRECL